MALPKRKHSKARRDKRRGGQRKTRAANLSTCPQCKKRRLPHRVCPHCGYYKGKPVLVIQAKEEKKK
ncbi:MAG: 50S ribosomal protein L32 [Candidatus Omnitrophica bacterium]|nr:50S ribosomal protein L32 [Candidatus Omnitrophota bacterium]HPM42379.1 50S ribosomal protein L32 [Candidatus Omnitrophota bacterium]